MSCLAHIFNSHYPKERLQVILVDNASTDRTEVLIKYLIEKGYPIIYLKQTENFGFVKGNNIGFKHVDTPYFMLLNNDAFVSEDCIPEMMRVITMNRNIGAVGAIEHFMNGEPSKGNTPFVFFKPKTLLDPELKSLQELGLDEMTEFVDVDIIGSACAVIRTEAIKSNTLMDERFHPAHYDQESLWMEIKYINGYRVVMSTGAYFQHRIAGTTSLDLNFFNKVLQVNKQKFLDKWLQFWVNK